MAACKNCDCADCKAARKPKARAKPSAREGGRPGFNAFSEAPLARRQGRLATMRGYSDAPLREPGE